MMKSKPEGAGCFLLFFTSSFSFSAAAAISMLPIEALPAKNARDRVRETFLALHHEEEPDKVSFFIDPFPSLYLALSLSLIRLF
uniref:Putative secreted protein n=1 Tax=Anopheles darlingi TaxID=43151 RepID=A0A2M4D8Q6_ANODA